MYIMVRAWGVELHEGNNDADTNVSWFSFADTNIAFQTYESVQSTFWSASSISKFFTVLFPATGAKRCKSHVTCWFSVWLAEALEPRL